LLSTCVSIIQGNRSGAQCQRIDSEYAVEHLSAMTKGLVVAEIRELELRLEGVDYPFEAVLMRINRLGISCATGGESRKGGW
jgi:hypothetical protein